MKSTDKTALLLAFFASILVAICAISCTYHLFELPYREFARNISSLSSLASMTGDSIAPQRNELAILYNKRVIVWAAAILSGPLAYLYTIGPFKKIVKKYWRKIK